MGFSYTKSSTSKTSKPTPTFGTSASERMSFVAKAVESAMADPFNADGVVENPAFSKMRALAAGEDIAVSLTAHKVGKKFIAASQWYCLSGEFQGDCSLPAKQSTEFDSLSEAMEHSANLAIRQVDSQLPELAKKPKWKATQLASLRQWAAKAVEEIRATDKTLPLYGLTFIEIFAGVGAASQAFMSLGAKPLLVIENNEAVLKVYQKAVHSPEVHKDICDFNGKGRFTDILFLGAPCTAHSVGGKREGLADAEIGPVHAGALRAVRDIDFKVAIVECAPGLLSPQHPADAEQWRQAFMKRNCRVQHRTINAADHGSAESRTRSFMVATRNGLDVGDVLGYIFPVATPQTTAVTSILDKNVKDDQHLGSMDVAEIKFHERAPRKGRGGLVELGRIDGKKHQGYRVYDPDYLGATITATGGGRAPCTSAYLIDGKPRGLTAREACRMHGLPEWFEHDTDLRRSQFQAGNSLSLPLVRELGRQLASVLNPRT